MIGNCIYKGNEIIIVDNMVSDSVIYYYMVKVCNEVGCDESNQDFVIFIVLEFLLDKLILSGGVFIEQINVGFEFSWCSGFGEVEYYEFWCLILVGNLGFRVYLGSVIYILD